MRGIFVGLLVLLAVGLCMGQTEATAQSAQDSAAIQNSETVQNSETKQLFVPSAPKTDFEASLEQMLKAGQFKPGKHFASKDYPHLDRFPSVILPSYCFTMKTYTFSTQADGSAPRLKGVSTCTRASNYQLREARPDVKIYPPQ